MRHTRIFIAVVLCGVTFGVLAAHASSGSIPSRLFLQSMGWERGHHRADLTVGGLVESKKARCLSGRTVKLYFERRHARYLRDVDLASSRNGQWGVTAESEAFPRLFVIKLMPKRITARRGVFVCAEDHVVHRGHPHFPGSPG
jgi:hypothetical protein